MLNNNDNASSLIDQIIKGIENVKGEEIQIMDLNNIENTPCKYFIICSGNSNTQVLAIVNSIIKKVSKKIQEKPFTHRRSGSSGMGFDRLYKCCRSCISKKNKRVLQHRGIVGRC